MKILYSVINTVWMEVKTVPLAENRKELVVGGKKEGKFDLLKFKP